MEDIAATADRRMAVLRPEDLTAAVAATPRRHRIAQVRLEGAITVVAAVRTGAVAADRMAVVAVLTVAAAPMAEVITKLSPIDF